MGERGKREKRKKQKSIINCSEFAGELEVGLNLTIAAHPFTSSFLHSTATLS